MNMIEVKTSELEGAALDWAVAKAQGYSEWQDAYCDPAWMNGDKFIQTRSKYRPSTDWSQCGQLIEKYRPDIQTARSGELVAYLNNDMNDPDPLIEGCGDTYLIAACRAIVAAKLGDTVQVPADLIGGAA